VLIKEQSIFEMRKTIALFTIILFISCCIILSCSNEADKSVKEGEQLARTYCASCHAFPNPSLLDKTSWSTVLPEMAQLMNVEKYHNNFTKNTSAEDLKKPEVSQQSLFPNAKWEKIYQYYVASAPVYPVSRQNTLSSIITGLKFFKAHFISSKFSSPVTTLVQIDTSDKKTWFADGSANKAFLLNSSFQTADSVDVLTGTVSGSAINNETFFLSMGILKPSDEKLGKLFVVKNKKASLIVDSLRRPVHITHADLNDDGLQDMVICEFGFREGGLSWYENTGSHQFRKHILRPAAGATCSEVYDFNKDGRPDIVAMMAQGDEGVFIYYNEGNGKFREERILQFSPVYGSIYFQLVDYNRDGFIDMFTANGDNADYSQSLKAYHGIRIFLNDGKNKFAEKLFLPVYGIQKAVPVDLDNDGDLDIASIAFFPDYESNPEESFIYWENNGDNTYTRYTFEGSNTGRWMTMDVGDMDGDGDKDIILGSSSFSFGDVPDKIKQDWDKKPLSVVILENTLALKK
jgi:hypothetical protein